MTNAIASVSKPCDLGAGVLLIGLGNILLGDEGVGVHVLRRLASAYRFEPMVACLDGGTAGLALLPWLTAYQRVLMIDAVDFRAAPGHIEVLRNEAIHATLQTKLSVHHLGVSDVLSVASLLDGIPEETVLVGMQPATMELNLQLSPIVDARQTAMIDAIQAILAAWDISLIAK